MVRTPRPRRRRTTNSACSATIHDCVCVIMITGNTDCENGHHRSSTTTRSTSKRRCAGKTCLHDIFEVRKACCSLEGPLRPALDRIDLLTPSQAHLEFRQCRPSSEACSQQLAASALKRRIPRNLCYAGRSWCHGRGARGTARRVCSSSTLCRGSVAARRPSKRKLRCHCKHPSK